MDFIKQIIIYVQIHWVEIGVSLWLLEQAMRAISKLTPWEFDDNITDYFANLLKKVFPRKTPTA